MTGEQIHFGTSGWGGIIAKDFTFGGMRRAAAAITGHTSRRQKFPRLAPDTDRK
jgi:hypothetical protein